MSRKEYRESVAAWLQRNRLALEISQQEIADAIGASDTAVGKWERGEHDISAFHQAKLRAFFSAQWEERTENMDPAPARPWIPRAVFA